MISKKIHESNIINMEQKDISINKIIQIFNNIEIKSSIYNLKFQLFEKYIINYFYEGISDKNK